MTNKTLIVGGAGFLGNSLAAYFAAQGIPTVVADSQRRLDKYALTQSNVDYIAYDWPDCSFLKAFPDIENVIHLAWSSHPATSMADVVGDASDNIVGTLKLLESLPTNSLNKFVFMSSGGTVYGNCQQERLVETSDTNPISAYGISKLACENYVNMYALRKNFSPVNIRLGNPYGSYQLKGTPVGVVASFLRKVLEGKPIDMYGDGETIRDFIYIDDFTQAMLRIVKSETLSGTYNLGSGTGASISHIIDVIRDSTNKMVTINHLNSRRLDVRSVVLNSDKLQRDIDFKANTSIEHGVKKMLEEISLDSSAMEMPALPWAAQSC